MGIPQLSHLLLFCRKLFNQNQTEMKNTILLTLILLISSILCTAQTNTFTGDVDDQWDEAGNWSLGSIPTQTTDVFIGPEDTVFIEAGYAASAKEVWTQSSGYLQIDGSLSLKNFYQSQIHLGSAIVNNGEVTFHVSFNAKIEIRHTFINNGTITQGDNGAADFMIVYPGGYFENNGTIELTGTCEIFFRNDGDFINGSTGSLIFRDSHSSPNTNDPSIWNRGTFTNLGSILIEAAPNDNDGEIAQGIKQSSPFFFNEPSGSITINDTAEKPLEIQLDRLFENNGTIVIDEAGNGDMVTGVGGTFENGGTISGDGEISVTNFFNTGNLAPGQSPGKVTRIGNSNIGAVWYLCEIAGTAGPGVSGGHDQYEVSQNLNLAGGKVDVTLLDGFIPEIGDQFTIVTTGISMINTFGTITYPDLPSDRLWEIIYTANDVILEVVANPLPIELTSFEVLAKNSMHQLTWSTATEIEASHFEIEHSNDGGVWEIIGMVNAAGEGLIQQSYTFDHLPNSVFSTHYYRLKMIDLDGSFEYSNIRSIEMNSANTFQIAPNPFNNWVSIKAPGNYFKIYNGKGAVVYEASAQEEPINLSFLPGGMYYIQSFDGYQTQSAKLFKPRK